MRKKSTLISIINILLFSCFSLSLFAQNIEEKVVVETTNILPDTTVSKPFFRGILIGADVASPIMKLLGQDHGGGEFFAQANLKNKYFPEVAFGMASGRVTADNGIFINVPTALYYKAGFFYNFLHKKDTPGTIIGGIRYGFSSYKSTFDNLTFNDDYWPSTPIENLPEQHFNSHWLELGGGIKVHCYKGLYLGWMAYYKWFMKKGASYNANPWFVPGYGIFNKGVTLNFNVMYQFDFGKSDKKK